MDFVWCEPCARHYDRNDGTHPYHAQRVDSATAHRVNTALAWSGHRARNRPKARTRAAAVPPADAEGPNGGTTRKRSSGRSRGGKRSRGKR